MDEESPCFFKDGPLHDKILWLNNNIHVYYAVASSLVKVYPGTNLNQYDDSLKTIMYEESFLVKIDKYGSLEYQRCFILK